MAANETAAREPSAGTPASNDDARGGGRRRVEKIAEIVARELVEQIRRERLQPGDRLPPEVVMLDHYQVARGSLREALRILEVYGLLRIQPGPGGGPVVRAMGPREYARLLTFCMNTGGTSYGDLMSSASLMESMLVRHAADRRDRTQMAQIRAALESAGTTDPRSYGIAMREFHQSIVSVPGGELLATFLRTLEEALAIRIGTAIQVTEAHDMVAVHEEIAEAIQSGDGNRAAQLCVDHRHANMKRFEKAFPGISREEVRWI
jgi:GntR family transcriptional repressor for pyruvate dehydrogenase complex